MAKIVRNIATEAIVAYLEEQNDAPPLNSQEFDKAIQLATEIFPASA